MQWPGDARDAAEHAPQLRLAPDGHLQPADAAADAADDRFEALCDELGILLARRVEPVSARVLPFGREQLAMVQVRDGTPANPTIVAAAAHGASRRRAVAEAAIDAMTQGNNVLAAALPGAVAEGRVRTAVVFADGAAPLRWGRADDEGRLAALFAVVPQLGTFTATAGADTYRVLRLPGIGVSLVTEGPSAAAWVEGWFAALIHATQYGFGTPASTDVVAAAAPEVPAPGESERVLAELEEECRRILAAAQDQARELLEAAQHEVAQAAEARRSAASELAAAKALAAERRDQLEERDEAERRAAALLHEGHERARRELEDRERAVLHEAARERALREEAARERDALLAEARREAEAMRRDTERACADLLAEVRREAESVRQAAAAERTAAVEEARREAEAMRRDAERAHAAVLEAARREAEGVRREADDARAAARARRKAEDRERRRDQRREEDRRGDHGWAREGVMHEARRAADDLLVEARRAAEDIVRDAARVRQQLADDARHLRSLEADLTPPAHAWVRPTAPAVPAHVDARSTGVAGPGTEDARAAELALLTAAAESVSAMATLLGHVAARKAGQPAPERDEPLRDVPGLFFGA